MLRRLLVVAAVALGLVPAAGARVSLGVLGNAGRFAGQTGQRTSVGHVILGWNQGNTWGARLAVQFATHGPVPLVGFTSSRGWPHPYEAITPLGVARGRGDDYLTALNRAIAASGRPIYIRPFPEMNGHWNAYCAYDASGRPKGAAYSTAEFRKAFARIYLAVHGGPGVAASLQRLGMPPFHGALTANANAIVIWNPQGYGSPDVPGNSAEAYYPGDAFVDVVGDDLYYIRGKAEWPSADALYRAHPGKPFAFPEWGLWGLDAPQFVSEMADFVHTHPRTALISYYSGSPGSIFDLASKPASRAAYRRLIVPLAG